MTDSIFLSIATASSAVAADRPAGVGLEPEAVSRLLAWPEPAVAGGGALAPSGVGGELTADPGASSAGRSAAQRASDAMRRVAASLAELLVGLRALNGEFLEDRLRLVGHCEASLAGLRLDTVADLARDGHEAAAAAAVCESLQESRSRAKSQVKLAQQLAEVPTTARALAAGAIPAYHAKLIAEAKHTAPVDEGLLLAAAVEQRSDEFRRTVRRHVDDCIRGEVLAKRRRKQHAQRWAAISQQPGGNYLLSAEFDPISGARVVKAISRKFDQIFRQEDAKNRPSAEQRMADAVEELITAGGSGKAPQVDMVVMAELDIIEALLRNASSSDMAAIAAAAAAAVNGEAAVDGEPLPRPRRDRPSAIPLAAATAVLPTGAARCRPPARMVEAA